MFPFYGERLRGYIEMHKGWCESQNIRRKTEFFSSLETWKHNAMWAHSSNQPLPPRPVVPTMLAVNEEQATKRFSEWETGLPQVFDFYIETPLEVGPDTFEFIPKPMPVPSDPVFGPDESQPGMFLVSGGYVGEAGTFIEHAKYGKLVLAKRATPFGPWMRWIKIA